VARAHLDEVHDQVRDDVGDLGRVLRGELAAAAFQLDAWDT
jgi:hypothetical protein